jgi:hypothetical protein|tara:strand:+ start:127 stop:648 length:522 start_codon:yes stop_codon:yes gene_type:complete
MLFGVVFTAANLLLLQHWKIGYVNNQLRLSEMRSEINNDFTDELLWLRVNDTHEATQEQLISQGRIEGVVSYLVGDDKEVLDNLWHEGYMRGLSQVDYEYETLTKLNYEKGYDAAMQKAFPFSPELVNGSPRNVKEGAIKAPKFDVVNKKELKDNEEVINTLNVKIKEISNDQ